MMMKFIGEVLGLIKKGELQKAAGRIEEGYQTYLKEDAVFFRSIPEDKLTFQLLEEHNYTNGHLEILAELFNAEAELELARNDIKGSLDFFRKTLLLLQYVDTARKTYSAERLARIESIRKKITELTTKNKKQ